MQAISTSCDHALWISCWQAVFDSDVHCSGHTCFDQVLGLDGAAEIARILLQQGVKFEFIHDEGTGILQDVIKGLQQPLAV